MNNKWELRPAISPGLLKKFPGYNKIILQLLFNRGLSHPADIDFFLRADINDLSDPFLFKDMKSAVDLVVKHIKEQNLIVIYGDYDADGVTATAVLVEILNIFKAKTGVYIPARASEGYGLNKKAIKKLATGGAKLIITVDNGIRNKEEVAYALSLGLEVIITDHHEAPEKQADWPDCLIINPKAGDYSLKYLAGVGVAFKLAQALIKTAKLSDKLKNRLSDKILDLVAIGTIADLVDLIGENRILVKRGLQAINGRHQRPGIDELVKVAKIKGNGAKPLKAWNIGWQIVPRLNSAGRLEHANTAYELLITGDRREAAEIAGRLNEKNQQRQKMTEEIFATARRMVGQEMLNDKILIISSPSIRQKDSQPWPEGVMGLVAGRLCEVFSRPALVITKFNKEIKGSGRSIDEFNILRAIERFRQHLEKFGGHAGACGFTLKSEDDLRQFSEKLKKLAAKDLAGVELAPKILIDAQVKLSEIDDDLLELLDELEPFGQGNDQPKFLSNHLLIADKINMGANAQHLKFRFGSLWAVAFGQAENYKDFKIGDLVDVVYYLEFNEFNGRKSIQMKIVDIKKIKV